MSSFLLCLSLSSLLPLPLRKSYSHPNHGHTPAHEGAYTALMATRHQHGRSDPLPSPQLDTRLPNTITVM